MFTIRFLIDRYGWDKCIEVFGWDEWMLNEGKALDTDTVSVSEQELDQLEGRKKLICSMHPDCTMTYVVEVDDVIVMRTDNHDAAFERLAYEKKVNETQGLHAREITLKVIL